MIKALVVVGVIVLVLMVLIVVLGMIVVHCYPDPADDLDTERL